MTITELFEKITAGEMAGWALAAVIVLLSLIQVSPLKFNPWDNIFAWFGKKMNGESEKRLNYLFSHLSSNEEKRKTKYNQDLSNLLERKETII